MKAVWKNRAVYNGDCVCNRVNLVAVKACVKTNNKLMLCAVHGAETCQPGIKLGMRAVVLQLAWTG